MSEMAEQALEEAERQWLADHPGCTVEDYKRDIEEKYKEDFEKEQADQRKKAVDAIVMRLQTTVEALLDGTYWVNKEGKRLSIWSIDKRYARSLCRWMEERREGLHDAACVWLLALPEPRGEQAQQAFEEDSARLNDMEPAEWLNDQPLYKHLRLIADGKEITMPEKQSFTIRCTDTDSGERRETWIDAHSKIEAAQKWLRRKQTAEWFLEGCSIKLQILGPGEEFETENDLDVHGEQELPAETPSDPPLPHDHRPVG